MFLILGSGKTLRGSRICVRLTHVLESEMPTELVHVGFGNVLAANRVIAVISPSSAPIKRLVQQGKEDGRCIDATKGRKPKAVVIMDDGHLILVAITPKTMVNRFSTFQTETPEMWEQEEASEE